MDEAQTPQQATAILLVGLAMIDGEVDQEELRTLIGALGELPGIGTEAGRLGQAAYRRLWALHGEGADLVPPLREAAARLAETQEPAALARLHRRLRQLADADGSLHPMENRLLHAFRYAWGLAD